MTKGWNKAAAEEKGQQSQAEADKRGRAAVLGGLLRPTRDQGKATED